MTLSGIGTFHKGGRTTSLGPALERNQQLDFLQSKIERALQRAGPGTRAQALYCRM